MNKENIDFLYILTNNNCALTTKTKKQNQFIFNTKHHVETRKGSIFYADRRKED